VKRIRGRDDLSAPIDPRELNVIVSEQEQRDGRLSTENTRLGILLLHARGYVILHGALPESLVAQLQSSFRELYAESLRHYRTGQRDTSASDLQVGAKSVSWERRSRFRIFPKLTGPFASTYVLRNPFAHPIIAETLGADYYCKSLSSDTCVKGSATQAPHRDNDFYDKDAVSGCLVNIPLMHCGLHNGPIEVWPGGSHLWRSEMFRKFNIQPFVQDDPNPGVEVLAGFIPSTLIELRPGDLMIRDPGMLHRGTRNSTDEPRTMLTAGYFRSDYYYPYGDPRYNLDDELYRELEPSVRQLFAPFFEESDWRYAELRQERPADSSRLRRYSQ
jgi:ectoine hydroxylase-related dioxygenase (phytanoyl-CoA dioxygenase family)